MKIFAVGLNYPSHNKEMQRTFESAEPVIFMKPDTALLKGDKPFYLPDFSDEIHYETELVLKISRLGKNIAERFAPRYYDEITVGIDFTARDLQRKQKALGLPWEIAKGFDGSAAVGTFIPKSEVSDIRNLDFRLDINGQTVQRGNTKEMICPADKIIAFISRFFTLKIGDIIFTGTPAGIGPVSADDRLQGYLEDRKLFDFRVK
ncbi:MAG: fumarylacetoacetate hydrolase family protein [Proteiniphilum sp.]|jgi:2-keto-4-pentenoate hydratase/2-oxohepta-3-ene-1,7-dioic acid hydratase in catechol pathway|nr:fumarylacetoacetate hydrolase family protein [Proteiniphilum sp.]